MGKICKLIMVEINDEDQVKKGKAKQSNKYYDMYEQDDGTFKVEFGRVDHTCQTKVYPMSKWDSTIKSKTRKGYKDVTELFVEEGASSEPREMLDITSPPVKGLFASLQSYANKSIVENYKVSSAKVTQKMVDEAQVHMNELADLVDKKVDVATFNSKLLELYHVIPRKMNNVNDYLLPVDGGSLKDANIKQQAERLTKDEQDTLDVMAGQVSIHDKNEEQAEDQPNDKRTLLDILGLQVALVEDAAEQKMLTKMMGPNAKMFRSAYKVVNNATQKVFDEKLKNSANKTTELYWHGSRNQNWLNILSTGLLIRPTGAIHTGSMFGDGIYFADKAQKSIGYSSLRGSFWTRGSEEKAYLALFDVHVGNQKNIKRHDRSCYSLSKSVLDREGYDSVFAHGGIDLRNNEYIVYDSHQCTIAYLIEISN